MIATESRQRVLESASGRLELGQETNGTFGIPYVKEVVQMMQNSLTAAYLRYLSFHERLRLIKCIKQEGDQMVRGAH